MIIIRNEKEVDELKKAKTLGEKIRKARILRGYGQREMARKLGSDPSWYNRLENGKIADPAFRTITRIADILYMSTEDFRVR